LQNQHSEQEYDTIAFVVMAVGSRRLLWRRVTL